MENKNTNDIFYKWNESKININENPIRPFYQEREIWWAATGINIGDEQNGKGDNFSRPILVLKGFSRQVLWSIPLSATVKSGKFYYPINLPDGIPRVLILSQLKLIDSKRLIKKMGFIDSDTIVEIKKAITHLLE
jgi:mRNA interferase MazF